MFNFSNCRLALLVALLLPSLSLAQGPPLPDQTTVDNTQQVTVYDSTLPVRERNLRITVGLLRSGLPATIESGECVQGNSAGTALVFATCASGRGITSITAVGATATITYTDSTTSTFTLPAGPTGAAGATGPAGAAGSDASVTAPNIIATVTGSPSTSLPVIKWTSSGVLTWSADNEGTGGGGGSSTIIGLTDTPGTFGTVGQVLAVNSGLNAVEWVDQAMGPRGLTGATGPTGGIGPTGADGRGISSVTSAGVTATVTYTDSTTGTFTLPAGPQGATGGIGPTGPAGAAGQAGSDASVTDTNIIAAVTGTPSAALPVIKWRSGGTLGWAADEQGTGGGGGSSTFVGLTDTPNAIRAAECVAGNALGSALGFVDCNIPFEGATSTTTLPTTNLFLMLNDGVDNTFGTADDVLEQIPAWRLNALFRIDTGAFDNTRFYFRGDIVETGTTDSDTIFWIAPVNITSGQGAPSYADPGSWFELAFPGGWRGEIDTTLTYNFHEGDTYHIGDEVYAVTADVFSVTGDDLREHDHIEELSNSLVQDEGTTLTAAESVRFLNFTGAGVTATLDAMGVASIDVPAGADGTGVTTITGSGGFTQTPERIRFTGAGVSLAGISTVTVTIPGGGGGSGTVPVVAFRTALERNLDFNANHTTWQHVLQFAAANVDINQGTFTYEAGSLVDTTERLVIPQDGWYSLSASMYTTGISGSRQSQWIQFTIERNGVETAQPERGVIYSRQNQQSGQTSTSGQNELEVVYQLEQNDRIGVQMRVEADDQKLYPHRRSEFP